MKKLLIIMICLSAILALVSCAEQTTNYDISDKDNIYEDMSEFIGNKDKYEGQTITLSAECTVVYNFSKNSVIRHTVVARDNDSDMRALYEIRKADEKYPKIGTVATVVGRFTEGYIEVSEFRDATYDDRKVDISAADKSFDELKQFITDYRAACNESEHYKKSIRIYGNVVVHDGYTYLTGLDATGAYAWDIELKAKNSSVKLPTSNTKYVNAYEIVGSLDMYIENNIAYACVLVDEITAVEGVLKVEEDNFTPTIDPFAK